MPVGAWGRISRQQVAAGNWRARARVRDLDGSTRLVERWGTSGAAAERALQAALLHRAEQEHPTGGDATIVALAEDWLAEVRARGRAPRTIEQYERTVQGHVVPRLGKLKVRELTPRVVDRVLREVSIEVDPAAARTLRSVLSGMAGIAIRRGELRTNPVRDAAPISQPHIPHSPRALTIDETTELRTRLLTDQRAVDLDLPDLVDCMLMTGVRIGEACAIRDEVFDAEAGVLEINAQVVRVTGKGVSLQPRTKTAAGWRRIAVPTELVALIERRQLTEWIHNPHRVIFTSPLGYLRDPSNTTGDLREALNRIGFDWVSSHTFRKTVATRLDDLGKTPRQIADHLGHAQPSMTLDVYMGRRVVMAGAAAALALPAVSDG